MGYLIDEQDYLVHYGTKHNSGRFPWGSGEHPFQDAGDFLSQYRALKKQGFKDAEVAAVFKLKDHWGKPTSARVRARVSIANEEIKNGQYNEWRKLLDKGWSKKAIAERFNVSETTVSNRLKSYEQAKKDVVMGTADMLANELDNNMLIDVGKGAEIHAGTTKTKLRDAVEVLTEEGYNVYYINIPQASGNLTRAKVLCEPDVTYGDACKNIEKMVLPGQEHYWDNAKDEWKKVEAPVSVDSKRVQVVYAEDGGVDKDGVIELRRGVPDLDMGMSSYAQVRIAVDGTHYLKGMAVYADDLPDGVDIRFNSNAQRGTPMLGPKNNTVLKNIKDDPENPFGAKIRRQNEVENEDGSTQRGALNIVREEGDWGDWSSTVASQMLSKQNSDVAKTQLNKYYDKKQAEYDEIMSLTNSEVQKKLLGSFADDCDSAAVHLQAAAFPRQSWNAILPLKSIGDNEIYAPHGYRDGEEVVLIRYPHGGIFEIPRLTVNNSNKEGRNILGDAKDAVGISAKTAAQLSGADFDGDTVLVIPTSGLKIKSIDPTSNPVFKPLIGFDPKITYKYHEGMQVMSESSKQGEMGKISNLITDMHIKDAPADEIVRAVKHSMVVIDAVKHRLDYKQSYKDNGIDELKRKYQGGENKGASTLISKAKSVRFVNERKPGEYMEDPETGKRKKYYIDPNTGKKLYSETGELYEKITGVPPHTKAQIDAAEANGTRLTQNKRVSLYEDKKTGELRYSKGVPELGIKKHEVFDGDMSKVKRTMEPKKTKSTAMAETDDPYTLSSGTTMENIYADHATRLKTLANQARKTMVGIPNTEWNKNAKAVYADEVASLESKLRTAIANHPIERKASAAAASKLKMAKADNPYMTPEEEKKLKERYTKQCRETFGSKRSETRVDITEKEWEAIQAGAISNHQLKEILDNTDLDKVKSLAMPKHSKSSLSVADISRIKAMKASGNTTIEIADALGVSPSTIDRALD